jgi:hypothetical protein
LILFLTLEFIYDNEIIIFSRLTTKQTTPLIFGKMQIARVAAGETTSLTFALRRVKPSPIAPLPTGNCPRGRRKISEKME